MKAVSSVLLSLSTFVAASFPEQLAHGDRSGHAKLAKEIRAADVEIQERSEGHTLHKRFGPGRMTFYDVGLGACGWWNNANDYIVAVNSAQFGGYAVYPPVICGKQVTISYNGKQVGAVVADECPTCGYGELDLSRGLFSNFAGEGAGVFYAEWWFNDGNSNPQPQPQPQPTTTEAPPPPTSEYQAPQPQPTTEQYSQPQPTTTTTPPPTTSSSPAPSSSSESPSSSSVSASDGYGAATASTNSNTPTPSNVTPDTGSGQNIQGMCSAVVQLGMLIAQAGGRELSPNGN